MKKFWNWTESPTERTLHLNGTIAEESWFDDDVTPTIFENELNSGEGDVTVWINSPGGDCVAAAQIYNLLKSYPGNVTVKIDGIAASAASVIAMAGSKVLVSPVSMLMIHNPLTMAFGNASDMQKAIEMLDEVKESIINAYELKTGMSRAKISHLMDNETWFNAYKAVELGFADDILFRNADNPDDEDSQEEKSTKPDTGELDKVENKKTSEESGKEFETGEDDKKKKNAENISAVSFSQRKQNEAFMNKLQKHYSNSDMTNSDNKNTNEGRSVDELTKRLDLIKKYI